MGQIPGTAENIVLEQNLKSLLLDIEHPIGSIWIGGKYEATEVDFDSGEVIHTAGEPINPADLFGGKWELIDKEFICTRRVDSDGNGNLFTANDNVSDYEVYAIFGGHTIRLRLAFNPSIALDSDSTVEIGNLILENIGVSGFYHSILGVPAMGDAGNGLVMANISNSGSVYVNDIVKSTTAKQTLYINEEITCRFEDMLNEFCDKFYWKRVDPTEAVG